MEGLGTGEYSPWNVAFVVFKWLCCVMLNPLLLQTDFAHCLAHHCASSANIFHAQTSLWCVHGKRLAIWSCTSSPSMVLFETDYSKMYHQDLFSRLAPPLDPKWGVLQMDTAIAFILCCKQLSYSCNPPAYECMIHLLVTIQMQKEIL